MKEGTVIVLCCAMLLGSISFLLHDCGSRNERREKACATLCAGTGGFVVLTSGQGSANDQCLCVGAQKGAKQ